MSNKVAEESLDEPRGVSVIIVNLDDGDIVAISLGNSKHTTDDAR